MAQFSIDNFNKRSNRKWKTIADIILYTLPLYLGAIMALPISDGWKMWINFAVTIVTVTIKGISKFTVDTEGEAAAVEEFEKIQTQIKNED